MLNPEMVQAYVVDLLERLTGQSVEPDADGDLPVQFKGGSFYARVIPNDGDPVVQVFSVAVADITATADVYEALNDINSRLRFARAFWVAGQVLIESEMFGVDVNVANVAHACRNVAAATDVFGRGLAERFGGRALFEDRKTPEYDANYPPGLGGYL